MALHVKDEAQFEQDVLKADKPVLVDFWAEWCGPCKMLAPIFDELAAELEGKAIVAKVNVEEAPALASQYKVVQIPTVLVFKNGEEVQRHIGAAPKDKFLSLVNDIA